MFRLKQFVLDNKKLLLIISGVLVIVGIVVTIVIITQNLTMNQTSEQIQRTVEDETNNLTAKAGEQTTLPDETPIIMTVSDKSLLTDNIFKDAENGDKVLVYEQAGIMVVYRENTNEIIATGKVNIGAAEDNSVPTGVEE